MSQVEAKSVGMNCMLLNLVVARYSVHRQHSVQVDGVDEQVATRRITQRIELAASIPEDQLVDRLREAAFYAIQMHTHIAHTALDKARVAARSAEWFERGFEEAGGLDRLMSLPIEGPAPTTWLAMPDEGLIPPCDQIDCTCGETMLGGSIATGNMFELHAGTLAVPRYALCPCCHALHVFNQRCRANGTTLNQFFNAKLLRGNDVDAWLNNNAARYTAPPAAS